MHGARATSDAQSPFQNARFGRHAVAFLARSPLLPLLAVGGARARATEVYFEDLALDCSLRAALFPATDPAEDLYILPHFLFSSYRTL